MGITITYACDVCDAVEDVDTMGGSVDLDGIELMPVGWEYAEDERSRTGLMALLCDDCAEQRHDADAA